MMKKLLISLFSLFLISSVQANIIYLNVPTLFLTDASAYKPYDTLWFIGQNPSQIYFEKLNGAGGAHIVVTADPNIVIGGGTSRNMQFVNSNFVTLYNVNINGHGNNRFGVISQFCSNFKYINITIDSCNLGIQHKCNPDLGDSTSSPVRPPNPATWYPNIKMYNISFYNVKINHINNEAFYIGHTYSAPDGSDPTRPPAPILGLSMEYCSARNTGWDGIQITGAFNVYLDSCTVRNTGTLNQSGQSQGFTFQDNTQGVWQRLRSDSSVAAGLNIFSVGKNIYKNVLINVGSYIPHSNVMFADNRITHGITLPVGISASRTLNMQDVNVTNSTASYALKVQDGTGTGLTAASVGRIVRLTYNQPSYTGGNGVSDAVPNLYIGGTINNIPDVNPSTRDSIVWFKSLRKDTWKIPTATTVAIEPLAPNFLYGNNQEGQVHLHWDTTKSDGGSTLLGYKVYRSLDSSTFSLLSTVSTGVQDFYDINVTDSAYYYYKVLAYTAIGNSVGTNCIKWRFIDPPPPPTPTNPDPPTNLSASAGNGFVNLSWAAGNNGNSPLTHYNIYRGTTSGNTTFLAKIGTIPSYTDNTVVNETRYYYTVTSENVIGESTKSTEVNAFPTQFSVPSAPTSFGGTPGSQQITLNWSAPVSNGGSTITAYKIYRGTVNNGGKNLIRTTNGTTFSYVDGGKVTGTTYYYTISAVNSIGEGPVTSQIAVTAN